MHSSFPNLFLLLALAICVGFATAYFARDRRGRSFSRWFLAGFFFGLTALLILWLLPNLKKIKQPTPPPSPVNQDEVLKVDLTPKLPMKDQLWYYLDDSHNQIGPVSFHGLKSQFKGGQILPSSFVWNALMKEWQSLEDLPEYLSEISDEELSSTKA